MTRKKHNHSDRHYHPVSNSPSHTKPCEKANHPARASFSLPFVSLSLFAVPIVLGFFFVYLFGINFIIGDQFNGSFAPLVKALAGKLTFSDLIQRHNEHIIFFPHLMMLVLEKISHFNTLYELYAIEILLTISSIVFLLVAKKQFQFSLRSAPLWLVPISFLTFSWVQWENTLWGFQIGFVLVQAAAVVALYFLFLFSAAEDTRNRLFCFVSAIVFASVCSFSSSMGFDIWVAGCIPILLSSLKKPAKIKFLAVFILIGCIHWFAFLHGYEHPKYHPSPLFLLHHPVPFLGFLASVQGAAMPFHYMFNSIVRNNYTAPIGAGITVFLLLLFALIGILRSGRMSRNSFWISLIAFSLLTTASISVGRAGFGFWEAYTSRYTTFSIPLLIGLYVLLFDFLRAKRHMSLRIAVALVTICIIGFSYYYGYKAGKAHNIEFLEKAYILYTYETQPNAFLTSQYPPSVDTLKLYTAELKKLRYNIFAQNYYAARYPELSSLHEQPAPAADEVTYKMDGIIVAGDTILIIRGDAACDERRSIGGVYVGFDGKSFPAYKCPVNKDIFPFIYDQPMVDQFYVNNQQLPDRYYFVRTIPFHCVGRGSHTFSIKILSADKKTYRTAIQQRNFQL